MEGLRNRDFGRSELSVGHVKSLSASATLVTGVAIRYKRNGQELERAGVTYVLHKAETGWKIAVLILHDADQSAPHTARVLVDALSGYDLPIDLAKAVP